MGGQGQGQGGKAPEAETDSQFESSKIRARGINPGKIVGVTHVRGLPPGEAKPTAEYRQEILTTRSSEETAREREYIPREDRDLVRDYYNRIEGVETRDE